MATGDAFRGMYDHLYRRFFANRERHQGYDFQHAPGGSSPVPRVTFQEKLRWWTLDRWRRRKEILGERDRLQQDIINMKTGASTEHRS